MSLRAFHAGVSGIHLNFFRVTALNALQQTVCAFLAIRQPDGPIAVQCLVSVLFTPELEEISQQVRNQEDIRGAITIFTGRLRTWLKAHPVQGHLCQGLVSLERLAT
jgi:hypothetical protein